MYRKNILLVLTICWHYFLLLHAKKVLEIKKINCVIKHNRLKSLNCLLTTPYSFSLNFTTPDEDFHGFMGVAVVRFSEPNRKNLMRYDHMRLELCRFLTMKLKKGPLDNVYFYLRKAAVNFPRKCPFKKNTTYTVKDFSLDFGFVPDFVPEIVLTFGVTLYANKAPFMNFDLVGAMCERNHSCFSPN